MFDRQKIILFFAKLVSYSVNAMIILTVVGVVAIWIYYLIESAKFDPNAYRRI